MSSIIRIRFPADFEERYEAYKAILESIGRIPPQRVKIENAVFNSEGRMVIINDEVIVSFASKRSISKSDDVDLTISEKEALKEEEEKTKTYKIVEELWRLRWQKIDCKVSKFKGVESEWTTVKNLTTYSKCATEGATTKAITRVNKRFEDKGVPIYIEVENNNARLIIDMS